MTPEENGHHVVMAYRIDDRITVYDAVFWHLPVIHFMSLIVSKKATQANLHFKSMKLKP